MANLRGLKLSENHVSQHDHGVGHGNFVPTCLHQLCVGGIITGKMA